jgi:DNA-directed RNA polymerase specialized sigma24 family protein
MPQFPATRHSIVAAMRSSRTEVRQSAFDALVRAYWKAVFKYVRLKWHVSPDQAADLTQAFFLRAFEKDFFAAFDPSRARFRTFLRTCLDRFVANTRQSEGRLKRGGHVTLVPIDLPEAERELRRKSVTALRACSTHSSSANGCAACSRTPRRGFATPVRRAAGRIATRSSSSTISPTTRATGRPMRRWRSGSACRPPTSPTSSRRRAGSSAGS